jgi:hypothetical protein
MKNGVLGLVGASWAPSVASLRQGLTPEGLMTDRFSRYLTVPPGRRYTSGMVRRVDSLSGAGIQRAMEKGKSYLSEAKDPT